MDFDRPGPEGAQRERCHSRGTGLPSICALEALYWLESVAQHRFMELLDADPARAEEKYRALRMRLAMFFQQNGAWDAWGAADESIGRSVKRIGEGAEVRSGVPAYCTGVAKNVFKEGWRKRPAEELNEAVMVPNGHSETGLLPAEQIVLLHQMMAEVPEADRLIFFRYHTEDREQLARELGVTPNALRIRVCRSRESIESRLTSKANRKFLEMISQKAAC